MYNNKLHKLNHLFFCILIFLFSSVHAEVNTYVDLITDLRSYFFQRDFKGSSTDKASFATGGVLRARVHPHSILSAGLSLYTSQGAGLNDHDKNVYNLLAKDSEGNHKNYTALGEAYFEIQHMDLSFKLGRQEMFTPWLNLHDIRMTPQSFDAASLVWTLDESMHLSVCHVMKMKPKTETHARSMSETAGFGGDEAVSCLGLEKTGDLGLKLWTYRAHEMWDDLYLRADYRPQGSIWHVGARYLNRNTRNFQFVGNQDTWHLGIIAGITQGNLEINTAYSHNGDHNILRKWGHETTISNQVMVADRAKEEAWLVGLKYTLPSVQMVQFSFSLANHNTPDNGEYQSPDRKEYNFDITYNLLKLIPGLSLRGRYAWVNESGDHAEDLRDLRFYLRYQHELI
jgi:hypothetical protein